MGKSKTIPYPEKDWNEVVREFGSGYDLACAESPI
jgi:hypothetical protein